MTGIDHHLPPIQAQRSKAFDKIPLHNKLADLGVKLGDLAIPALLALGALIVEHLGQLLHRLALPRCNLRRMQLVPGRQLATVSWPLIASSATLALNSAENRLRVLMVVHPLHRQIHLSPLSQEVGPPLDTGGGYIFWASKSL